MPLNVVALAIDATQKIDARTIRKLNELLEIMNPPFGRYSNPHRELVHQDPTG
jgi:hypothetical protein